MAADEPGAMAEPPIERYGQLQVVDTTLCDESGEPVDIWLVGWNNDLKGVAGHRSTCYCDAISG